MSHEVHDEIAQFHACTDVQTSAMHGLTCDMTCVHAHVHVLLRGGLGDSLAWPGHHQMNYLRSSRPSISRPSSLHEPQCPDSSPSPQHLIAASLPSRPSTSPSLWPWPSPWPLRASPLVRLLRLSVLLVAHLGARHVKTALTRQRII